MNDTNIPASTHLDNIAASWAKFESRYNPPKQGDQPATSDIILIKPLKSRDVIFKTLILTQRNFINYVRNLLAFGIRSEIASLFPRGC
jgi:hypothetical protein